MNRRSFWAATMATTALNRDGNDSSEEQTYPLRAELPTPDEALSLLKAGNLRFRRGGHVLDQAALGSIKFGVSELHIPLLVVLGHKRCGAIKATLDAISTQMLAPGSIEFLASAIRPAALLTQYPTPLLSNQNLS